ncbi:phosphatidylinositol-specific phospholipase C [Biscogniauxia sp. FL1348]|nr:phosphatidylinositol-specific phospholipase C [Biscogniauxia sp. FL1348]
MAKQRSCCFPLASSQASLKSSSASSQAMADLTIRNLTATPLELKLVERYEEQQQPHGLGKFGRKVTGLFCSPPPVAEVKAEDQEWSRQEVSLSIGPFETRETDIRTADPGREALRLTFESDGHRYQAEVPISSQRSTVMTRLDGAPNEYTTVYVQPGYCLAIFSSANLSCWMRELHDEYPLSALSIPGTHNSPTCHVALPSVRCQAVGMRAQLDNGVRFFDIRVNVSQSSSQLALVHSAFPISFLGSKHFKDLVEDVYAFLDANPSETLIMSVKREGTGNGTDQRLSKILKEEFYGDGKRWFTEPRIPKLGEARGKIVLLRRHGNDESLDGEWGGRGWGLDGSVWPDNCEDSPVGSGIARIQDFYEVGATTNIQKKIELAHRHLERASELVWHLPGHPDFAPDAAPQPFFVNFLSASNFFNMGCWPEKVAAKANPAIIEYLCLRHGEHGKGPAGLRVGDAGTGIVVTDWVGLKDDWDLIRCIVGWNAKLQLKQ